MDPTEAAKRALSVFQSIDREKRAEKREERVAELWCSNAKPYEVFDFRALPDQVKQLGDASADGGGSFAPLVRQLGAVCGSPESLFLSFARALRDRPGTPLPSPDALFGGFPGTNPDGLDAPGSRSGLPESVDVERIGGYWRQLTALFQTLAHPKLSHVAFRSLARLLNSSLQWVRRQSLSRSLVIMMWASHPHAPFDFLGSLAAASQRDVPVLRILYSVLAECVAAAELKEFTETVQNCMSAGLVELMERSAHVNNDRALHGFCRVLGCCYLLNEQRRFVDYQKFVNEDISSDDEYLSEDFRQYLVILRTLKRGGGAWDARNQLSARNSASSSPDRHTNTNNKSKSGGGSATSSSPSSSSSLSSSTRPPSLDNYPERFVPPSSKSSSSSSSSSSSAASGATSATGGVAADAVYYLDDAQLMHIKPVLFADFGGSAFSFILFPFLLSTEVKSKILTIESLIEQRHRRDQAIRSYMFGQNEEVDLSLTLEIDRQTLVEDSLNAVARVSVHDLQKKLNIVFKHEEAQDEGGVKKEWFQLLIKQLFDPIYGMFEVRQNVHWFRWQSDELMHFNLLGTLLGLAIYNSVILDLHFPSCVYKTLLGRPLSWSDFEQLYPDLARGFQQMLQWTGSDAEFADTFDRAFEVEYEQFGETKRQELVPGGAAIALRRDNAQQYVALYAQYVMERAVARQVAAFKRGFDLVCQQSDAFKDFRWEELKLLICGSEQLDFKALEASTEYESGYSPDHPIIKQFWAFFHSLPLDQKKRFLHFTTGSDRAPIGGLGKVRLVIVRHGDDCDRLPSAHTCFSHLMLPEYASADKMKEKLLAAIENAEGFGMM